MPLWITAAQPSVLEKSIYFENGEVAGYWATSEKNLPTWYGKTMPSPYTLLWSFSPFVAHWCMSLLLASAALTG